MTGLLPDLGGTNPFHYILLFIDGYVLIANCRLSGMIDRQQRWIVALALPTAVAVLATVALNVERPKYSTMDIGVWIARCGAAWWSSAAMIGLGRRHLNSSGPVLHYAREASYPVYILHQTVILLIAYLAVGWQADVSIKYVAILVGASAATLLIYGYLIRRFNPIRFLFGMKTHPRQPAAPAVLVNV